jgi:protoporphyrinogen oxidase
MYRKHVWPMNTAMDLLRFGPLSFPERLRMGLMGIRARFGGLSPALDDVTAEQWIRGLAGDRAFDILWKPLLSAKIGDHYPALPALWLSSRMNREKSTKAELKGCLGRGYKSLIDAFEKRLRELGTDIRFLTRISSIERDGERMRLVLERGAAETYDVVVCTSPLPVFQRMTASLGLDPRIANLGYQGVVSGVFLMEKPLTHYYWMPWVDSGATSQGAIEMSNLVPLSRAQGLRVTYLVNYTHRESELFKKSDAEILAIYRRDLEDLFPEAAKSIVDQYLFRAPFVEPIWTVGYADKRPPTTILPGRLYLACTAQVYPRVNSWNSCCEVVDEMVKALVAETSEAAA